MTGIEGERGQDDWSEDGNEQLETERLALDDAEERLPWLESADDDYDEEDSGEGTRMLGLLVMGLLAVGVLVGGIWWASNRAAEPEVVADGSLVPAPPGPYKEAPKDPGGKTFAGTGDSSFAVSEGQNRPAQLGGASAAAAPVVSLPVRDGSAPAAAPAAAVAPAKAPSPAPAPARGGVGVQVGAFSSKATAEAGWNKLVAQAGGALSGVSHRVIEGKADNGTIFRLQAVASDSAGASALCSRLKSAGIACQVK